MRTPSCRKLLEAAVLWYETGHDGSVDEVAWFGSEQSQSRQSVAAFCGERGLRAWQFYEWKKRRRESEAANFVEVQIASPAEPVGPAGGRSSAIEIRLKGGRRLLVEPGFDARHLCALLSVLEAGA